MKDKNDVFQVALVMLKYVGKQKRKILMIVGNRIGLLIFMVLFVTSWSPCAYAKPTQDALKKFSWEGLSLSMSFEELISTLERDGYAQSKVKEGRFNKKVAVYKRKTAESSSKVQINAKDGVVNTITFKETRIGGKNNMLSAESVGQRYSHIKNMLHVEDSACKAKPKGGGVCSGMFSTDTADNSFSVVVSQRSTQIVVSSKPLAESVVAHNLKTKNQLDSAYACYKSADITSVREVHDCIQSSSRMLSRVQMGFDTTHHGVKLDSSTLSCSKLTELYKRALSYGNNDAATTNRRGGARGRVQSSAKQGIDQSAIPDCKTFAGGIERALGRPPYWANCTDPGDDDDSIKACIEGYTPALVKSIRFYLPKCEELQKSYKISVIAGQPKSKGYDVTAPDCQRMLSLAKSWRPDLPDILKPCEGYDPDKTAEHVNACLAPEKIYIHMRNCQEVRAKYKYFVGLANGSMPADFYPLPCDQAEPLLAKAAALREKRRKEAEEFERKMAEIQARKKKAKQEYIYKLEEKMAKKYADSPENVASRTSALEKQIKATGQIPKSCNGYYCPPTKEEMRLAMMRNQSQKIGLRIINGHLMHGKLPTMATYMMMFAGQQGKGTIGVEAHYKEVQMIYDCKFVNGAYECYFKLPFTTKYDELTSMYMDGLSSGLPFNLNDMVHNMIGNALAREEYSYLFQIDAGGLWRASPTMQQEMRDMKKQLNSIQSQIH